jgi:hypothetical protein
MLGPMAAAAGAWFLSFHGVVPPLADEAYQALAGFGLAEGIRFPYYSTWPIHPPGSLAQGRWPLMSGVYEGLPGPYLLFPLWKLLGVSLGSVRLADALCALASAGLFVGAAKELFGKRAAVVLGALIFLNAHFLIAGQTCLTAQTAMIWLCLGGLLYSIGRWSSGASRRWLGLAGFSLGLGLWAKIVFLWYALAVPPALLLLKRKLKPADWAAFCGCFVVGVSPLLYFNACARWRTVTLMAASLAGRTTNKVDNLDFLGNAVERLREIRDVLTFEAQFNWFVPARLPAGLKALGFLLLAPAAGFYALRKAPPARFLFAVLGVVSLGLCFTVSWFATYQLLWVAPVYLILAAAALSERIESDRALAAFLALALLPGWAALVKLPAMGREHARAVEHVAALADALKNLGGEPPALVVDPADEIALFVHSGGKVLPQAAAVSLPPQAADFLFDPFLRSGRLVWTAAEWPELLPPGYQYLTPAFRRALEKRGARAEIEKVIPWPSRPGARYELVRIVPKASRRSARPKPASKRA